MKRVIIALLFMFSILAGCIYMVFAERHNTAEIIKQTEIVEQCYRAGDDKQTAKETDKLQSMFKEKTAVLFVLMRHEEIEDLQENMDALPYLLENDHTHDDFLPELVRCRSELKRIRETEIPILKNIL